MKQASAERLRKLYSPIDKANKSLYKHRVVVLSFVLPSFVLLLAYMFRGIFPIFDRDVLIVDLYHQYAPFISDLQDKFTQFSSFLYSWTGGLGTSYLPQYAYYSASPLNIFTLLFPKEFLTETILFLTVIKAGLAGGFFTLYLKGVHKKSSIAMIAFALMYALSGYYIAYSWNIMWLDAIYLLPLVILGLVKLIRDGRGVLYAVALGLTLLANFYVGFFVCIFSLLYFPVCYTHYHSLRRPLMILKKSALFGGFSLLGGGLSAVLLLPTAAALKLSSAAGDVMPKDITQYYDLFDYISRHFTFAEPAIRDGMPNMFCGIIVLILLPVYFFSRRVATKDKIMHAGLMFFMFLSFNLNILNFLWHGMHYPNQLNYRFAFVYIFLVVSMCYIGFTRLREFSGKQLGAICTAVFVTVVLSQKLNDKPPTNLSFYASMAMVTIYTAALTYHKARKVKRSLVLLAATLAIIFEMTAGTIVGIAQVDKIEGFTTRTGYSAGPEVRQIRESIKELKAANPMFFRMEIYSPRTTNDSFLYNYNGLSIFSSTFQEKPVRMFENLGYHSNGINSYKYEGSTMLLDSLFGIKYLMLRDLGSDQRLYNEIKATDEIWVYENPYVLPLGFHAGEAVMEWESGWADPFEAQNNLYAHLSGERDILYQIPQEQFEQTNLTFTSNSGSEYYSLTRNSVGTESIAKIRIIVEQDQQVYLYIDPPINDINASLAIVGNKSFWFNGTRATIINLGYCTAGTIVEIQLTFNANSPETARFTLKAAGLDLPKFESAIEKIRAKSFNMQSFSDTRVSGTVDAPEDGYMIMTVPYDKGWKVKVDGAEAETQALDNCLLAFKMSKGTHSIEMNFLPDKFIPGLFITLASIAILAVVGLLPMLHSRRKHKVT